MGLVRVTAEGNQGMAAVGVLPLHPSGGETRMPQRGADQGMPVLPVDTAVHRCEERIREVSPPDSARRRVPSQAFPGSMTNRGSPVQSRARTR